MQNPTLKLKQLTRQLQHTNQKLSMPSTTLGRSQRPLVDILDQKIDKVQYQLSMITTQNELTFNNLRDQVTELQGQLDDFRREIGTMEKIVQASVKQRSSLVQESKRIHDRNIESIAESIQLDLENKQNQIAIKMEEEDRLYQSQLNMYQRKAQKVLVNLANELNTQKRNRTRSLQTLQSTLTDKVKQTQIALQTETKARMEMHKRLQRIVEQVNYRLEQDLDLLVKERKESNHKLLKMLQVACDTLY